MPAAPRLPASDAEVVERLPGASDDPAARELASLRAAWRHDPQNPAAAAALARRYVEQTGASGDPRYIGYAQAALAPWWDQVEAPVDVRVQRAVIRQFGHAFDLALNDLHAAVAAQPDHAEAWSWIAALQMVRANYGAARQACQALAPLVPELIAVACVAAVDGITGNASRAAQALRRALARSPRADPAQRLWVLTRLAEIEERRGEVDAAETAFRAGLALGIDDVYLRAAYADFLLDRGRAADVIGLLNGRGRADVLLLRLAIAARATAPAEARRWAQELAARFDAARMRGDTSHRKEEARFALQVQSDAARALALARDNFAQQREAADARLLLEAALAAGQPAAARPALDWIADSAVESQILDTLAARLGRQK